MGDYNWDEEERLARRNERGANVAALERMEVDAMQADEAERFGPDDDDDEEDEEGDDDDEIDEAQVNDFLSKKQQQVRQRLQRVSRMRATQLQGEESPTIGGKYLPEDNSQWLRWFGRDPAYIWRVLSVYLKMFTLATVPASEAENAIFRHEIVRLLELVDALKIVPAPIAGELEQLGERLWTYLTKTLHSNEKLNAALMDETVQSTVFGNGWWKTWCLLRTLIVSRMPDHRTFGDTWYCKTPLANIVSDAMNDAASEYLSWAHASGWTRCAKPAVQTEDATAQGLRYLAALGVLTTEEMSPESNFQPVDIRTLVIPDLLASPMALVPLDRTWRQLSVLHSYYNRLKWTPSAELFVLLLWHHVQSFSLARAPRELYTPAGQYWWTGGKFRVANEYFAERTSHLLIRQLAGIHAFYSLRTQVKGSVPGWDALALTSQPLPVGLYDAYATMPPSAKYLTTKREFKLVGDRVTEAHSSDNCEILPGLLIDKHSVKTQLVRKLPASVIVPGDISLLARMTIAMKLMPLNILTNLHPSWAGVLADLTIPYSIGKTLFDFETSGRWPEGQDDWAILGAQAYSCLFYAILRTIELSRPERKTLVAAEQKRKARDALQNKIDNGASLADSIRRGERALYQQVGETSAAAVKTTNEREVEYLPELESWWNLTEDKQHALPLLYPSSLKTDLKPDLKQPRIITHRGEHWIHDAEGQSFFGRTYNSLEAHRLRACLTAFLYPTTYRSCLEPLLVNWFDSSLQAYARAGQAYASVN